MTQKRKKCLRIGCLTAAVLICLPVFGCGQQGGEAQTTGTAEVEATTLPESGTEPAAPETGTEPAATAAPVVPEPLTDYRIGTINAADGKSNLTNKKRFYNEAYNALADVTGVTVTQGYELTWLAYDAAKKYLGNANDFSGYWQGNAVFFTSAEIRRAYPEAVYFRFAVKNIGGTEIKMTDVEKSDVRIVPAGTPIDAQAFANTFPYLGTGFTDRHTVTMTVMNSIPGGQDGAVYGDLLFRFDSKGKGTVLRLPDGTAAGTIVLERTDLICPHGNSVTFGAEKYAETDEFPLLYSNVYNTYASAADRREGTCCVYRITRSGANFRGELVQVIRIGFAGDLSLWSSLENGGDVRPYGNFVVDAERNQLWAFVMRDKEKKTRFFSFALPPVSAGEDGILAGVRVVTLGKDEILTQFDTEYMNYMQGACIRNGLIYSVEGFTDAKKSSAPALRVIDTGKKAQVARVDLYGNGYRIEPELLSFFGNQLIYSDNKGKTFAVTFGK